MGTLAVMSLQIQTGSKLEGFGDIANVAEAIIFRRGGMELENESGNHDLLDSCVDLFSSHLFGLFSAIALMVNQVLG